MMRERQQTAEYLKQVADEIQGMRDRAAMDMSSNLKNNAVMAGIIASIVNQNKAVEPANNVEDFGAYIEPEVEDEGIDAIDAESAYLGDSGVEADENFENDELEVLQTSEFERVKRTRKNDAKTQLIDWMLQQSQSDDEDEWYIHRIMKNTLPLADILNAMPEEINVKRAAMGKFFSSVRSGEYDDVLEAGIAQYQLPRFKVFVANRAAINAAPPAAKRGRKSKKE